MTDKIVPDQTKLAHEEKKRSNHSHKNKKMESSKNIYLEESVIQLADRFGTKIWTFQSKKKKKEKEKVL